MTRELIFVQTGQCGNQIGSKYWDVALRDLAKQCQTSSACFDRSMNVLFRNLDHKTGYPLHIGSNVSSLKARAVLVDMEKGVIDSISRSPLGELFTQPQIITDVSGSGNNWATGYVEYGSNHGDDIMNAIRTQLESCDCVDSVVFLQSLSGGTGSGLGSFILDRTADDFSKVNRMMIPVFPSVTDDVVTAPYNSVLALNTISENGNIVMTVDNDSLFKHYNLSNSQAQQETHQKPNPFDAANTVVAEMIQGLSFSLRFGGDSALFPSHIHAITCGKQKFLSPAIYMGGNTVSQRQVLSFEKAISSRYDEKITLCRAWRKSSDDRFGLTYWGGESIATVLQATSKANPSGISLFGHTQVGTDDIKQPCGVLKLSRNGSMHTVLEDIRVKFSKFYKRKAHLHHYLQHIEASHLEEAVNNLMDLIATHRGQSGPSDIRIVQERSHHADTSFLFNSAPMGMRQGYSPYSAMTPMAPMAPNGNSMIGTGAVFNPPGAPPNPVQPQSNTWLFRNQTAPAFTPPAPAEAAAMWSNHVALAAQKAKMALNDIHNLRQSAISQVNDLRTQAQTARAEMRQQTDAALSEMQQGSIDVINNYALAKAAVAKMYKAAEKYAVGAYKMAQDVNDAKRTQAFASELKTLKGSTAAIKSRGSDKGAPRTATSSFAKKPAIAAQSSFEYQPTGDPELDRVLAMIKKYADQTTGGASDGDSTTAATATKATSKSVTASTKSATKSSSLFGKNKSKQPAVSKTATSVEDEVVDAATEESAKDSAKQLDTKIDKMKSDSQAKLSKASPEAVAYKFAGEIAKETLLQDASNTINQVIESARQITDDMTVRQVQAEGQINETISQTEQTASDLLQNINDVSTQADNAMKYIDQLKDQALYAHNAAGQAMAAQMAQAMGFPISAKGITSPFPPPPSIQQASIDSMLTLISLVKIKSSDLRNSFI